MRIEDLRSSSRASRSTTYRIVRSLLHSGYIERDRQGRYHLNPVIFQTQSSPALTAILQQGQPTSTSEDAAEGFERWGVRFRPDARWKTTDCVPT